MDKKENKLNHTHRIDKLNRKIGWIETKQNKMDRYERQVR